MFDLIGKVVGGLTQLAQEEALFSFLRSDPGMGLFLGGFGLLVLIILPIGPAWMRTVSWVGKGLAGVGILAMFLGTAIVGLDYALAKAKQLESPVKGAPASNPPTRLNLPPPPNGN